MHLVLIEKSTFFDFLRGGGWGIVGGRDFWRGGVLKKKGFWAKAQVFPEKINLSRLRMTIIMSSIIIVIRKT